MTIIIFADKDGASRSIRGNCVQPCMGGASAMTLENARNNAIYTAVLEVYAT